MNSNKFYTWIDVQDALTLYFDAENHSNWLQNISFSAYWDGLNIRFAAPKTEKEICEKLADIFLARFKEGEEELFLILENNQKLPILFECVEADEIGQATSKPSLARKSALSPQKQITIQDDLFQKPVIFAFHSFKGGVGRTLNSIAFALHLASEKQKVLLIDADFEAPGITWLMENREIAFSDFLAMIHGASDPNAQEEVIRYTAEMIKNTVVDDTMFLLPSFRNLDENASAVLEIKPEHILKFSKDPFILSELLSQLGKALGVDYVIIDLRAGVSELSTSWLLDPRIQKVFVTTLSSQAILGTAMLFQILAKFQATNKIKNKNNPFVIVNQIPNASMDEVALGWAMDHYTKNRLTPLRDAYLKAFLDIGAYRQEMDSFDSDLTEDQMLTQMMAPYALFVSEYDGLKQLPDNWKNVCDNIRAAHLPSQMSSLTQFLPTNTYNNTKYLAKSLEQLEVYTRKMIYAEEGTISDFLTTESIRKLANHYKIQVPIAVVVGVKGTGKTFLYQQLFRLKNWKTFVKTVGLGKTNPSQDNGTLFPVTVPANMADTNTKDFIQIPTEIKRITNGTKSNIWGDTIKPDIEQSLQLNLTVSQWRDKWLDYMAWATGFEVGKEKVGTALIAFLAQQKVKIVGLFDGLEDLFKAFNSDLQEKKALQALLQDVPNWLESHPVKYLGLVIFVRKDIVLSAITQNSGQFLAKYSDFELKWNTEEALRLVNWILIKANVFNDYALSEKELGQKNEEELKILLYRLWGMKMAKDTSNDAFSHNWILSSLSNLKKEIQARDIVRFLANAAEKSKTDKVNTYSDRILFPASIKNAMIQVGIDKIEEVKLENEPLKKVLEKLETKTKDIKFPCKINDIKNQLLITDLELKVLEDNGVILLYNGEYYMAELYRKGIGFEYSRRGRPKVLQL
ncbi:MAG: hypothetical protein RIS64_918 [Bacteroidota bacterium]|jgi:MinD-like ATPase involved in chromosome partitioning or flagellar assembly